VSIQLLMDSTNALQEIESRLAQVLDDTRDDGLM
jgi:hypothetical protein